MIKIFSPRNHNTGNDQVISQNIQENIHPFPHEMNTSDGGEFLDDAIRMTEQPFEYSLTKDKEFAGS